MNDRWGELWEKSLRDLYVEAALRAIDDAGVDHIDSMYVACMSSGLFTGQEHVSSLLADYLGVAPIPAVRVESACASGGNALRLGWLEVASGASDLVLVGGVEKMTDVDGSQATLALAAASDFEWEAFNGVTFPGLYAMMARRHMHEFGTTPEQLAAASVKNHHNGTMNPVAQFQMEITVETVLNSVLVADPLHILDCSPVTDGAAAVILCPADQAKKFNSQPVKIAASAVATDAMALHSRESLVTIGSAKAAAEKAYKQAGLGPGEIDLAEVHDCFTISEICLVEDLGFTEKGKGGEFTESGATALDGRIPVNTSGGLKSKGHPVGATGVAQAIEVYKQLRGEAGKRQVKGAKRGLCHNMGGSGGTSAVHILEVM